MDKDVALLRRLSRFDSEWDLQVFQCPIGGTGYTGALEASALAAWECKSLIGYQFDASSEGGAATPPTTLSGG